MTPSTPASSPLRRQGHCRPSANRGPALRLVGGLVLVMLGGVLPEPAHAQPRIGEALPCEKKGVAGGLAQGNSLGRVDVPLDAYPDAVCNDGTPAVFYARAALTAEARDSWHIHLQGGGGCGGGQSCAQRWCSVDTNFGADKMSSSYAPEVGTTQPGILRDDPRNPVGDWNQVLVYYCTSDGWAGRADDRVLEATAPGGEQSIEYRMPFRGADVIDAVLDMLGRGQGPIVVADRNGVEQTLPDLDRAERVLFAGASAGGGGVTYNADRVHTLLRERNERCSGDDCPLDYRVLVDSTFDPETDDLDYSQSASCLERGLCSSDEIFREQWDGVLRDVRQGQETEDSCAAWHRTNAPETEFLCASGEHVVENHVSSPLFLRMDLQDSLLLSNTLERRLGIDGRFFDASDFGARVEQRLRRLADRPRLAEEDGLDVPVVLGAQCTKHESLRNNDSYFDHLAPGTDGLPYATPDLLRNWLEGTGPREAIVPFRELGRLPACDREVLSGFPVDLTWTDFEGTTGLGQPVGGSSDSGLFRFFDPDNWEVLVKVLDTCSFDDSYWVFAAATTNAGYTVRVQDPRTLEQRTYTNELGSFARAVTDTEAFPCEVDGAAARSPDGDDGAIRHTPFEPRTFAGSTPTAYEATGTGATCADGPAELCLTDSRFEVRATWRDFRGNEGSGLLVPFRSEDSGLFYFFEESNWELLVKVLDACGLADRFWVFAAGTTNLEYALTVTDTVSGAVREYRNPLGSAAEAIIDTDAFSTCDAVP